MWFPHRHAPDDPARQTGPAPAPPRPAPPLRPHQPEQAGVYDWQQDAEWPQQPPAAPRQPQPQPRPAAPRNIGMDLWRRMPLDGEESADFPPRPPTGGLSYRPDTVCDGWSTHALDLRLASVRGQQHRWDGRPREDDAAAAWDPTTGAVVIAVADGVSDARQPHIGSQLACRSTVDELLSQVRAGGGFVTDWQKLLSTVHWQLREQAGRLLRTPDAGVAETADLLATTLVAGVATPTQDGVQVALLSVGDSGVWQIKHEELYPMLGGKTPGSDGLLSSAVQPLPYVPADFRPLEFTLEPGSVLLVGTDGFGDPVGDGRGVVGRLFADQLRRPVPPLGFAHLLDFSRETFDDDRTLIALWPRDRERTEP
ncbi:protein phosphatase 2C domain-containing protein [Streptomyces chromofuscus]|uniref:Protein phosphatase 2C domain-containing protein n=1 Tax=Streptomyces chromofuscus TaxID=42881 RepID=A0A7M2T5L2_STRCW|nr:protein phosphatase 2C domain-containing protein [Streptomyces chromofuscus]QOV43175.1 protein phosphatase 2C domain-containing protein [Streptomyces chromofuscus]GGT32835.1 hypothetical protein GCM10010254_61630 [Streptomyces chromofuscus]